MKISIGTTYYNNPDNLKNFISTHLKHVDEMIIVDDGSMIHPAIDYIDQSDKIKLYRVTEDLGFNSHGCRNLIMKVATNDWVILMDSDREMIDPEQFIDDIKSEKLDKNYRYHFSAIMNDDMDTLHTSVNDFLIHKDCFFSAGGYDEELVGIRDGDRYFFEQLDHFSKRVRLEHLCIRLVRQATIIIKDNKEFYNEYQIEQSNLRQILDIIRRRIAHPEPNKPIINFKYVELL